MEKVVEKYPQIFNIDEMNALIREKIGRLIDPLYFSIVNGAETKTKIQDLIFLKDYIEGRDKTDGKDSSPVTITIQTTSDGTSTLPEKKE